MNIHVRTRRAGLIQRIIHGIMGPWWAWCCLSRFFDSSIRVFVHASIGISVRLSANAQNCSPSFLDKIIRNFLYDYDLPEFELRTFQSAFYFIDLNPGSGIYKAENFVFLLFSYLRSWRSQFSHLFVLRLRNPVYLAQVCISIDRTAPNTEV